MEITINHSEAENQHSEIVKKWIKEAKSSKSLSPEHLKWSYSFGVKAVGMNGTELVRRLGTGELFEENKREAQRTPEQVAEDILGNVVGLSLRVVGIGFKREKSIKDAPSTFVDKYKAIIIASEKIKIEEQKRFDSLSPQEQQQEEAELINELFNMGGFFGVSVGQHGMMPITPKPVVYDMDDVLDKISKVGVAGLTAGEKKFLDGHSKK